jgi:glycerophosphoryl diester phosphodiesterase
MRRTGLSARSIAALLTAVAAVTLLAVGVTVVALSGSKSAPVTPGRTDVPAKTAPPQTPATPARRAPLVLAHRGGIERARENTMRSFEDAIAAGADYIETDVRHSADGVGFLIHNPELPHACTPHTGVAVRSLTAAQLAQVRCAGQPVPRLADLVARLQRPDAARISVFIELKDADPLGVRNALAPLGWSRVIVQSADYDALRQLKQASPQVRVCPLVWGADELDRALAVTHECVAVEFHLVDANLIAKAHAVGAVVLPFTVDDPVAVRNLVGLGADGIITNLPRLARRTLALDLPRSG